MIQLKPTQLYAVKVPDDATEEQLVKFFSGLLRKGQGEAKRYELIGTYQSGNIDFDAGEYVKDECFKTANIFKNFVDKSKIYRDKLKSFTSLLEANQVPIRDNEKYCLLKLK